MIQKSGYRLLACAKPWHGLTAWLDAAEKIMIRRIDLNPQPVAGD